MHFIAEKPALAAALSAAAKVAERNSTIPILNHALLHLRGGQLSVTATNCDMEITTALSVQGRRDGVACLPIHKLSEIVKAAPDGSQVEILAAADGASAFTIKYGRSRYALPSLSDDDFPKMGMASETGVTFTLPETSVKRLISATMPFMSKDTTRYYLCGIYLHQDEGQLIAVATNGHCLGRAAIPAPDTEGGQWSSIIIPDFAVKHLHSLPDGEVTFQVTETKMGVSWGATTMTTKLVDGVFPDYQRITPTHEMVDAVITVDSATIRTAATRVALASKEKTSAVRLDIKQDGSITFHASGENGEESQEAIDAASTHDLEVGFNASYLSSVMQVCGAGEVTIRLNSSDRCSPSLIYPSDDQSTRFVVMPMRV